MVEAELVVSAITLLVVVVVLVLVGIAYYRTGIRRLLVLFLLAALLGVNMTVMLAEEAIEGSIPGIELLSSLFALGIALLLLLTALRRFERDPK